MNTKLGPLVESTPLEFFQLSFSDQIFENIQTGTNRDGTLQINIKMSEDPLKKSLYIYSLWKAVTVKEIKLFFTATVCHNLVCTFCFFKLKR